MRAKFPKILITLLTVIPAFLFVLYLSVLSLFPKYFNTEKFKTQIEHEIYTQTGLRTGIENIFVKTSLTPYININANHVILLYPDKKEFLKVRDLNLKVKILPVVFKKIEIEKIIIHRPVLSFSVENDGRTSLDKILSQKFNPKGSFSGFKIQNTFPDIELNNYKIKIYDKNYKKPFIAEGEKLKIEPLKNSGNTLKIFFNGTLKNNNVLYITYSSEIETSFAKIKNKLLEVNIFDYIKKYNIKGNVVSKITVKQDKDKIKVNGLTDINALSFVLNGKKLDNNFIHLKIKDNIITTDTDLKTGINDRIKISGNITTGKNPKVNLKCLANNIDLRTLKETAEAITKAFNIKTEFSAYDITGKANFNFHIKGNNKSLQSQGFAEILNASVSGKDLQYKINKINSKINLDNNKIKISDSNFVINDTAITFFGDIDEKTNINISAKSENLDLDKTTKIFLPSEITQKDTFKGILNFNALIKGNFKTPNTTLSAEIKDFAFIQGKNLLAKMNLFKINLSGNLKAPDGNLEIINADILPETFSDKLKAEKMVIKLKNNVLSIPSETILLDGQKITLNGEVTDIYSETPSYSADFQGNINSTYMNTLTKQIKELKNIQAAAKGTLQTKGSIKGKGDKAEIKAEFLADKNNYLSFSVIKELLNCQSLTTINATVSNNEINLKDLTINKGFIQNPADKIISLNGKIKNLQKPVFENFNISIPKSLTVSAGNLKNSEITIKSEMLLNGNIQRPVIKGFLEIKNILVPEYKIKSMTNNIKFEDDRIIISMPNLEVGNSKFNITGKTNNQLTNPIKLYDLKVKANVIDLDELNEIFSDIDTETVYPGFRVPLDVKDGKAVIDVLKTGGLQAENISGDISISNNVLKLTNLTGKAYRGDIAGQIEYNFLQTITNSEISGKSSDMNGIIKAMTGKSDEMSGIIDYKLKVKTIGTKKHQQTRTAKGFIEFTAQNGVMGPLGQFEHFLYAQNLISQSILKTKILNVIKAIKPQNTGKYTISRGTIEILGGNAYLKPVTVEGPNMSLYIKGKYNILNDLVDIKIYGRISQDVEKVLGGLTNPISQTILSKSSETSVGNLFYEEYNTTVPKSITDAIPNLNPNTGLSSRPFVVEIQGIPDNVKSVKSFKWIVSTINAPTPNVREIENNQNTLKPENTKNDETKNLPSFLDNIPDNFNSVKN